MTRAYLLFTLFLSGFIVVAQTTATNPICENEACSEAINDVKITAPVLPGTEGFTTARTTEFQASYQAFKKVKNGHASDVEWQNKYRLFELGGSNCRRYYDLESRFAHEYEQNPDFKAFIDRHEPNTAAFQKAGFESSRRGLNLSTRFKRDCPQQERKAEKNGLTTGEEQRAIYDKLGQVQGYWDDKGNTLKQLEAIPAKEPADKGRMSKKERVEQLTQRVAALPLGPETTDEINQLSQQLASLAPQVNALSGQIDKAKTTIDDLLPKATGLGDKIEQVVGKCKELSGYTPKIPKTGILDKIKGFLGLGKQLKDKVATLKKNGSKLKDDLGKAAQSAQGASQQIADQGQGIKGLLSQLDDLKGKRDELNAKLADKPRKILDELTAAVSTIEQESKDLKGQINKGGTNKDQLSEQINELQKKKEVLSSKIGEEEKVLDQLSQEESRLDQKGESLCQEVEKLKKQEGLKEQVENLEPTNAYAQKLAECEEELKGLLGGISGVEKKKEKAKSRLGKILSFPGKLLSKVTGFIDKHSGLKAILSAIPGVSNLVNIVDGLFGKSKLLAGAIKAVTGKQTKLMNTINGISKRVDKVKSSYEDKVAAVDKLKDQLTGFAGKKTSLLTSLGQKIDDLSPIEKQVIDLVKQHQLLGENSACNDLEPIMEEVQEVDEELDEVEPQITEIEEELEDLEAQADEIETATNEVEEQVSEAVRQQEEIKKEEEAIKEEFGQDISLDPVPIEEWSESFEVVRPYWEATFHPDDEVVEGYKGRYFQVQLKDADKTIKLLFGPGEYHMSKADFRDNYGSVIGAFVTEALAAIRKRDREGVKLFVQGSADISGAQSFRGNLDESFYYDELDLLPMKGSENFAGASVAKTVAERGFTNEDLPNLRGQFMKEMITIYSKKLQPILLEGSVKKQVDKEDRNAVIYLFLPEEILKLD